MSKQYKCQPPRYFLDQRVRFRTPAGEIAQGVVIGLHTHYEGTSYHDGDEPSVTISSAHSYRVLAPDSIVVTIEEAKLWCAS